METRQAAAFSGKKALVVGGTGGIGREVALLLAENGAALTIHGGSSTEKLKAAIKAITDSGGKAAGFLLPIDNPSAAKEIIALSPPVDILVCAWGPFRQASLDALDIETWQDMTFSNLAFPGILVSHFIKGMMDRNWGRILLFGGTNTDTIRGFTTTTAYSAAKTALGVIAKSAAKTAGSRSVTCNVVCPGLTDTEYTSLELRRYNRLKSPSGQALSAKQVALAALAIISNPAINGAIVPVDEGLSL